MSQRSEFEGAAPHSRRVPPLQGGRNFRDMGGYPARDGRRVKWATLYRSGAMSGLTDADHGHLTSLGIKAVCDLRTQEECVVEPNRWATIAGVRYWSSDRPTSFGELRKVLASGLATVEAAQGAMLDGYRRLPFEQTHALRVLFRHLRDGDVPMVFNCTAGKDRTGAAAALVLTALGVEREAVIEDYALTNTVLDFTRDFANSPVRDEDMASRIAPEISAAVAAADPSYICATLDVVEERHGSIEAYLQAELEIGEQDIATIRAHLLE